MPSFPDISGGPVWDRPLRGGIKPEERADDIRPYGRVENRDGGRMISAPTNHRGPPPCGRTLCAPTERQKTKTAGAQCAPLRKPGD